ncbi:hypothetical protein, partial [Acinetobacter pittii]|uniref:hypothetical protein n=1 Tax=Acinetobacter pittii TaxID=48296 RepID=UPI00196B512B
NCKYAYSKSGHFYFGETGHFYLGLTTTVRIMYIMLNKRFGKLLPYIRLWLLYVATTPFMLHYTELLKACSTASVAQAI